MGVAFIESITFDFDVTLFFADGLDEVITTVDKTENLRVIRLNIYIPIQVKLAVAKAMMEKGKWSIAENSAV